MKKPINKWILIRMLVLAAVGSFLLAATNAGGDRTEIKTKQTHRIHERVVGLADRNLPGNLLNLKFSYGGRKSFRGSAADRTVLISEQAVYGAVGELRRKLAIPLEIQVAFKECGGPDSYYDEKSHEINICYELIEAYSDLFSQTVKGRTERDEATKGAVVAMFLHEVAHGLIDCCRRYFSFFQQLRSLLIKEPAYHFHINAGV